MRYLFVFCVLFFIQGILYAQPAPSPEQFLGYKVGAKFTLHSRILAYFEAVEKARPSRLKIEKYGTTNEGRDLELAFIGLPENLKNLESIRLNNLGMAGLVSGNNPLMQDAPAIVWLSYNVHGNEPASSEAAMLSLYALTDDTNAKTQSWLKNTIVIIDPCMNPDGRDRYVNWYNSVVGKNFDANPQSREHSEPWPRGRSNHYYFDLNRDWAWQTQKETQQRMIKYNEWLPQVHVDFHEQSYNQPYYFAPAAEPFHEAITPWQREFQIEIGKNNARYFDANGWLYFTKERFDLFYPSYGDTYPIYNGAIGMTYEQGGINAGLGVKTADGDTLTLTDRALHHFTASLATVETSSLNATKLVREYKKYFDNNKNAQGSQYKTYVLTSKDANRLQELAILLKNNGIQFGITSSKSFKGYNYFSGKEESFVNEGYQLAVSAYQPGSVMVKVLFEPKTYLSDSATYDITAWSLPYAYGIKAYAVKDKLEISNYVLPAAATAVQSNYGILIPYTSFNASKVLASLLAQGVKVRFSEKPFVHNGKKYDAGTLIVLKGNNIEKWNDITNEACMKFNVQGDKVESGFVEKGADFGSPDVKFIKPPKVALLSGAQSYSLNTGEVWNFFDQVLNYPLTQINADEINRADLNNYDVLILPNGNYRLFKDKPVLDKLEAFVKKGGKIIAMENAVAQMADMGWGMKLKEEKTDENEKNDQDYSLLKKYGDRERDELMQSVSGAIYKVDLDSTHPLGFGYPAFYYTLKQNEQVYEFIKDGWNVGVIKQDNYVAGFVGNKLKQKLRNALIFGVEEKGNGSVVYLSDNPLFRLFWENGKMLFSNAVFLVGQ